MNALIFKIIMFIVGANKLPDQADRGSAIRQSNTLLQIEANVTKAVTQNLHNSFDARIEALQQSNARIRADIKIIKESQEKRERQARIQMRRDRFIYLNNLN